MKQTCNLAVETRAGCSALEAFAADQLRIIIQSADGHGIQPTKGLLDNSPWAASHEASRFLLGVSGMDPKIDKALKQYGHPALSEQDYLVLPLEVSDGESQVILAGGSPAAVLWAVYELAEFWGVRFLLNSDVYPAQGIKMTVPEKPIQRSPAFNVRAWRGLNHLPHSGAYWGLKDYQKLIDQLAKLRFNCFYLMLWSYDPFVDYAWGGISKSTAELSFGWRFPIDDQTIGREQFGQANWYENPDIPYDGTYQEKIAAAAQLVEGVRDHARARGMKFAIRFSFTEIPKEFKDHLRELSLQDGFVPKPDHSGGYVYRLGITREGMDPTYSPFMSIRNPRFVDLIQTQLDAYFKTYPDADYYVLQPPEFANSGADAEFAWSSLRKKYDLSRYPNLDDMIQQIKRELEDDPNSVCPQRIDQHVAGHICMLFLLDQVLANKTDKNSKNEDTKKTTGPHRSRMMIGLPFASLSPLTSDVLGSDLAIMPSLGSGYLASDAARHTDQLEQVCEQSEQVHLTIALEDDNIGVASQFTAPSLEKTVHAMHRYGVSGLWCRQWLLSKLEPATFYLSHACWDSSITTNSAYRDLLENICGPDAVEPLLEAIALGESITIDNDEAANTHSFLIPVMLIQDWDNRIPLKASMLAMGPKYERLAQLFEKGLALCTTSEGKTFVEQFIHQARFAKLWITVREKVALASLANQQADLARESGCVEQLDHQLAKSRTLLNQAVNLSQTAIEAWALAVRDRADLGVLAALNSFGHRYLLSIREIQSLRSNNWGLQIPKTQDTQDRK